MMSAMGSKEIPEERPDENRPTVDEVLERVAKRRGGRISFQDAAEYVRADRDSG